MEAMARSKKRLGQILVEAKVITEAQLQTVLAQQKRWGGRLGSTLIEMGLVKEKDLVQALSSQLGIPSVDLDSQKISPDVQRWLKVELAEKYSVFPLGCDRRGRVLHLATTEPTNYEAEKELTFHTGMAIQLSLAGPAAIERAIRKAYHGMEDDPREANVAVVSARGDELAFSEEDRPAQSPVSATETPEVSARLEPLLRQMDSQKRALQAILELLEEKGHLGSDELPELLKRR
jgi:type IV pilus assembly protein PilB